ncbi:MAG: hypothetical protein II397_14095, partial [Treponema sp.]|nr:hypothetical protein [Treponema sp.]
LGANALVLLCPALRVRSDFRVIYPLSMVPAFASIPPFGRNTLRVPFQSGLGFMASTKKMRKNAPLHVDRLALFL